MHAITRVSKHATRKLLRETLKNHAAARAAISTREKPKEEVEDNSNWPRKIFSGIQPTGCLHLGNYLGAVQKWTELQNSKEDVTYCIVDLHSITLPQEPAVLRQNILQMAATMLACGIDPKQSTMFVQSAVKEHSELCWILNCLSTMARLGHLPQYKEKSRSLKDIPTGLFVYPVLQAADIMLYKTTHVPVGEDQLQHIQLTQHLTRIFNTKYGSTFPVCHAVIENKEAARIRSLRDPTKKMSKSDPDSRASITLMDEPDVIVEKIKKAVTDFTSDVTYDPEQRQGVSNLVAIHSLVSGQGIEKIVEEALSLNTGQYKLRVAEAVVEHLTPIRTQIQKHLACPNELIYTLELGAEKARQVAEKTMVEVRLKVGLGAQHMPALIQPHEDVKLPITEVNKEKIINLAKSNEKPPLVPQQQLRYEKPRQAIAEKQKRIQMEENIELNAPVIKTTETKPLEQPTTIIDAEPSSAQVVEAETAYKKVATSTPSSPAEQKNALSETATQAKEEVKI